MKIPKIRWLIPFMTTCAALTLLGADCGAPLDFVIYDYKVPACHMGDLELPKESFTEKGTKIIPTDLSGRITCIDVKQFGIHSDVIQITHAYVKTLQSENDCHLLLVLGGDITTGGDTKLFWSENSRLPKDAETLVGVFETKVPALKRRTGPKVSIITVRRHGPMSADLERLCKTPSSSP